jgi:pyrroline-5-carboxylate reductase
MASNLTVGFLGAGKMASALASGFIRSGVAAKEVILASDVNAQSRAAFTQATGARTTGFNPDVAEFASVLIVAVKPDQVVDILKEISPQILEKHLIVSIAAGVPLARLESSVPSGTRVVRVMPNTPALVGASATGFALGKSANTDDAHTVSLLFSAVGVAHQVKESLLDAVTGLSGSGPAYIYMIIEAMSDGGVAAGLPRDVATKLAAQTVLGSAKMLLETNLHPAVLKEMVTSPGGTTIEGVHELEKAGLRAALINAVRAAAEKAKKLGQG